MAFICTFDPDATAVHVVVDGAGGSANMPIGYDSVSDKSYSLFVNLDPQAGGDTELGFCVIEYDRETEAYDDLWSAQHVAKLIPAEYRRKMLQGLLQAIARLIGSIRPSRVFMCTIDAELPAKALRKYEMIAHIFEQSGYAVRSANAYHGRKAWWMERR